MARGQAGGAQSSSARDMKLFLRDRMWREHRYALLAVGVIVVALFGSAFLQFSTSQTHMYRLEVTDPDLMERVFRSGEPWVVLCSGPNAELPEVFDKVAPQLAGRSFVGVLDCRQKLPKSSKSVLMRYGLKSNISPTIFTVANGEKPKQVFLNYLQSTKALAKHVKARTKKIMKQVHHSAQLEARCLSRPSCVLFLRGQRFEPDEKVWIDTLLHKHRTLSFVWVDSTSHKLSLENMLPSVQLGSHRLVLFRRQRDPKTNKKVLAAKAYRGEVFDDSSVGTFLDDSVHAIDLKPLARSPKVLHRKKNHPEQPGESTDKSRRPRPKKRETDEEGDDYYFPQHVDQEERVDSVEDFEEEDVLDLDDTSEED